MTERHLTATAVFVLLEKEDGRIFFLRRRSTGGCDSPVEKYVYQHCARCLLL